MSGPLSPEHWLQVIERAKLVSVDLLLENEEGEFLLGYRNNKPAQNSWFVPGGSMRKQETILSAIARVALNELGIQLENPRFYALAQHHYDDNFANKEGVSSSYIVLGFYAKVQAVDVQPDDQHEALKWWSRADLLASEEVHPYTKAYFADKPDASVVLFRVS